uniref:Uncharacterized protein n=1 Tax=viral metagenome TaxID=1070528 RepID=A0A6C0BX67_9ZZZZ
MNQYMITGGGGNHNYGVLPPLFNKFQEMAGGAITHSEHMNHVAVPMTLLFAGGERTKKRDYEEITHDEVIKDDLYDKLLELLQVKNPKNTSRKKEKNAKEPAQSHEMKKRNNRTKKNI